MSNPVQTVARHLAGVAEKWRQSSLHLDAKGYCSVRTDDDLDILLEAKEDTRELLFVADLATSLRSHIAARLLHENLFARDLRCATFCRDAAQGRVFLRYHYPIEALTVDTLASLISNFVNTARAARDLVQALASGKDAGTPAPRPAGGRAPGKSLPVRAMMKGGGDGA